MLDSREAVGQTYIETEAQAAQALAWQALAEVGRSVVAGMTEADAKKILTKTLAALGSKQKWHPPQVRFGCNTIQPFGKPSKPGVVLGENDLFFLDIGPVFNGYEADVGQTFVLGNDPEMLAISRDAKIIFDEVRARWSSEQTAGVGLYEFAQARALTRGWRLSLAGASGHRIGDFPHSVHHRGKLLTFDKKPAPNRWILEIHIFHPSREIAAFYEDVL